MKFYPIKCSKISLVSNTSWYLFNFRNNLINSILNNNDSVFCFSPVDKYSNQLGGEHKNWHLNQTSQNPIRELIAIIHLKKLIRQNKIEILLSYTPKGNFYSLIAILFTNVKVICNISGLGVKFKNNSFISNFILYIYKKLLKNASAVFFQNKNDMSYLVGINKQDKHHLIPGSGVDLLKFSKQKKRFLKKEFNFSFIGRLLKEKGVYEYIEAVRLIKEHYPQVQCALIGFFDKRKKSINQSEINEWEKEGLITYLGSTDNVKSILEQTVCLVLPTYYNEGVPRSILEASAMELPVITTDHPGCRDAVADGLTGLLCEKKNANDLAKKMMKMIKMTPEERKTMGKLGRVKMENEFDEKIVIDKYLEVINSLHT